MPSALPLPPTGVPFFDAAGQINPLWQNYLQALESALVINAAPIDGPYVTYRANTTLTNEVNLGALTTGYLYGTVAAGVSTISSVATIPVTQGGTGLTAVSQGDLVYGSGANVIATLTKDTNATRYLSNAGADNNPVWAQVNLANGVSGQLPVGNGGTGVDNSTQTYTPTLTGVANVTASTAYLCHYLRVGAVVSVWGKVDIDPTSATTLTQLGITLPVASNLGNDFECAGSAAAGAVTGYSGSILGDAANNRAQLDFVTATDVANRSWGFSFGYRVI